MGTDSLNAVGTRDLNMSKDKEVSIESFIHNQFVLIRNSG